MSKRNIALIILSTVLMLFSILYAQIQSAELHKQVLVLETAQEFDIKIQAKAKAMEERAIQQSAAADVARQIYKEAKQELLKCQQKNL